MKLTSLGPGPECHLLEISDAQLLLECPLDLSVLPHFLPTLPVIEEHQRNKGAFCEFQCRTLIDAEPWYKTSNLAMLEVALIDAVIISNPLSMLGLPFLTRHPEFSGKVFASDATARAGLIMMEELRIAHDEYTKLFALSSNTEPPAWINTEVFTQNGSASGNWHHMFSAEDVSKCMEVVERVRYGEEASIDDFLYLTAFSSGFCLGSSNWVIKGPWLSFTYIAASSVKTNHASVLNVSALEGSHIVLISDAQLRLSVQLSSSDFVQTTVKPWVTAAVKFATSKSKPEITKGKESSSRSSSIRDQKKSKSGIQFVCKAAVDAVERGGCALIPIYLSDKLLQILEELDILLTSTNIPIFLISAKAEDFLAFANTVPEWRHPSRQEKLYAGESMFSHVDMLKAKRLHHLSSLSSSSLASVWREPCVVIAAHESLRLGAAVHLLHRWRERSECCLILTESELDMELLLAPFKPMKMQVLHIPLNIALRPMEIASVVQILRPATLLVAKRFEESIKLSPETQLVLYSNGESVEIAEFEEGYEVEMCAELATKIKTKQMRRGNAAVGRVRGEMCFLKGFRSLEMMDDVEVINIPKVSYCGNVDKENLLKALKERGLGDVRVVVGDVDGGHRTIVSMEFPSAATVELRLDASHVKCDDPVLRRLITDALTTALQPL